MDAEYEKLCVRCRLGYEPSRTTVHGSTFWLHDGIYQCGASSLREEQFKEKEKHAGN